MSISSRNLALATAFSAFYLLGVAQAQTSYDLRALTVANGLAFGQGATDETTRLRDFFNNGSPLVGPAYINGVTGTAAYAAFGSPSIGAELSGPAGDFFGTQLGAGRMRFQLADAAASPSNLDAAGTVTMRESLFLTNPATPLLTKSQTWEVEAYWNYALPDVGSVYGLRISDNPLSVITQGTPFNDQIDFRLVRNGSTPVVSLRRQVWDGAGTLSVQDPTFYNLADALFSGRTIADIAVIGFRLHYNAATGNDPGGLIAGLDLIDAAGVDVGYINYAPILSIFNGEEIARALPTAYWTVSAVPEPSTWLMSLVGFGALIWRVRRRA